MYRLVFQPLLFLLSPEKAHAVALALLELLLHIPGAESLLRRSLNRSSPLTVAGIRFPNPVGIAAGFDMAASRGSKTICLSVLSKTWSG